MLTHSPSYGIKADENSGPLGSDFSGKPILEKYWIQQVGDEIADRGLKWIYPG